MTTLELVDDRPVWEVEGPLGVIARPPLGAKATAAVVGDRGPSIAEVLFEEGEIGSPTGLAVLQKLIELTPQVAVDQLIGTAPAGRRTLGGLSDALDAGVPETPLAWAAKELGLDVDTSYAVNPDALDMAPVIQAVMEAVDPGTVIALPRGVMRHASNVKGAPGRRLKGGREVQIWRDLAFGDQQIMFGSDEDRPENDWSGGGFLGRGWRDGIVIRGRRQERRVLSMVLTRPGVALVEVEGGTGWMIDGQRYSIHASLDLNHPGFETAFESGETARPVHLLPDGLSFEIPLIAHPTAGMPTGAAIATTITVADSFHPLRLEGDHPDFTVQDLWLDRPARGASAMSLNGLIRPSLIRNLWTGGAGSNLCHALYVKATEMELFGNWMFGAEPEFNIPNGNGIKTSGSSKGNKDHTLDGFRCFDMQIGLAIPDVDGMNATNLLIGRCRTALTFANEQSGASNISVSNFRFFECGDIERGYDAVEFSANGENCKLENGALFDCESSLSHKRAVGGVMDNVSIDGTRDRIWAITREGSVATVWLDHDGATATSTLTFTTPAAGLVITINGVSFTVGVEVATGVSASATAGAVAAYINARQDVFRGSASVSGAALKFSAWLNGTVGNGIPTTRSGSGASWNRTATAGGTIGQPKVLPGLKAGRSFRINWCAQAGYNGERPIKAVGDKSASFTFDCDPTTPTPATPVAGKSMRLTRLWKYRHMTFENVGGGRLDLRNCHVQPIDTDAPLKECILFNETTDGLISIDKSNNFPSRDLYTAFLNNQGCARINDFGLDETVAPTAVSTDRPWRGGELLYRESAAGGPRLGLSVADVWNPTTTPIPHPDTGDISITVGNAKSHHLITGTHAAHYKVVLMPGTPGANTNVFVKSEVNDGFDAIVGYYDNLVWVPLVRLHGLQFCRIDWDGQRFRGRSRESVIDYVGDGGVQVRNSDQTWTAMPITSAPIQIDAGTLPPGTWNGELETIGAATNTRFLIVRMMDGPWIRRMIWRNAAGVQELGLLKAGGEWMEAKFDRSALGYRVLRTGGDWASLLARIAALEAAQANTDTVIPQLVGLLQDRVEDHADAIDNLLARVAALETA